MTQVILSTPSQSGSRARGKPARTTIQITPQTKEYLDRIKEQANVETYDQAIHIMIRERKKHLPSSFGKLPAIGCFTRQEDDSDRIPY